MFREKIKFIYEKLAFRASRFGTKFTGVVHSRRVTSSRSVFYSLFLYFYNYHFHSTFSLFWYRKKARDLKYLRKIFLSIRSISFAQSIFSPVRKNIERHFNFSNRVFTRKTQLFLFRQVIDKFHHSFIIILERI